MSFFISFFHLLEEMVAQRLHPGFDMRKVCLSAQPNQKSKSTKSIKTRQ